jgi:FkbM family methyltransferase
MLSKKYLTIKKILTGVSKISPLHRKLVLLANMYLDIDRGHRFSYMSDENGESDLIATLAKIYDKQAFVFFDVGAHVGTYTDMVLERFGLYTGHLFDLSHTTLDYCIQRHGHNKNLVINNVALNDTMGDVEYRFYPGTQMQNGISGVGPYVGYDYELRTAPGVTGDYYCTTNQVSHIHLLKIDTEGYDLHVLRGFDGFLSQRKVDVIQFEYNIKSGETHAMLGDFYEFLRGKGYVIGVLRQSGVEFREFEFRHNDFNSGPNYVACLPKFQKALSEFKRHDF